MAIWTELANAGNDAGDQILLRQRGDIYEIRYNGLELMSNINFQSEIVLAERSLRFLRQTPKRILIGGLGMGFTLRAALDYVPPETQITVCELIPDIIEWNRSFIGHLADHPLRDRRVELQIGDVMETLKQRPSTFDLILMDTDNGPDFLVREQNDAIYSGNGLAALGRALTPTGTASFWSATASSRFETMLDAEQWNWDRHDVCLISGRADAFHHIYSVSRGMTTPLHAQNASNAYQLIGA
ncbi:spermidine synthase [Ochrobactrum sp. 19YEA23]|uniref:spermidine synthase n=1 Tax=Ochrobactrum sp. 19YEA23 TaxID=3039854 RepID=UPI0024799060|nr:spermidine synthase [Ochrobactrum sp. 19YEA23]